MPYWSGATYRGILRALSTGGVVEGPDTAKLRELALQILDVDAVLLCGSGGFALEIALRACGVGPGDEVVIPTFCCTAVLSPILAVGARPVLADVGEELNLTVNTVAAVLTEKTKAIIVPHLFGNPADIDAIIDFVGNKVRVIDDAAQALGATIGGRPVGSFGDAGIVSFGGEKVCAGIGGGVFVSRSRDVFSEAMRINLPLARRFPALQALGSALFLRRWRRWTKLLSALLRSDAFDMAPAPYRSETMANLNAAVAVSLVETLGENLAARRARVTAYQELLGADARLALVAHRPGSACLTLAVRALPQRRGEDIAVTIIEALGREGFEVQGSYLPIHLLPGYRHWGRRALPRAEEVWSDLIELPCEPSLSFAHLEKITAVVKRGLRSY